jgi:1-deoxy-D-xylulose-5-phosphate synthase
VTALADLQGPEDLKALDHDEARELCTELRQRIIETVAVTGGHLGSSLGVIELTVALHRVLDSPRDRIVWDTGHQAYAHKLLTGRLERFDTLRQLGGVGGFPRRTESEHDVMDGGHAGTGISIAAGIALARDRRGGSEHIAVVVGDAALMSGLSLEALNDIGQRRTRLIIVLNDNEMSISPTVGAVSQYLSRIKLSRRWRGSRRAYDDLVARVPAVGPSLLEWSRRLRHAVVEFSQPGQLFEDLGITYVGPVPGHDLVALDTTLRKALLENERPILIHVRTRKGLGYRPAEVDKVGFHGAALPPMGRPLGSGTARSAGSAGDGDAAPSAAQRAAPKAPGYGSVVVGELIELARADDRIVAVTAGMPTGTSLARFGEAFPGRLYDVGIAEQHAMTLATGLALAGLRPFVALYSTFLQRAFDQVVHDVCQNDAAVVIGIDRAGLVGEDGTSHQGIFTLSALRQLPNLIMAAPRDEQQARRLLRTAFGQAHPFAIQYPRDPGWGLAPVQPAPVVVGSGEVLEEGREILIVGLGPIIERGREAAQHLRGEGWSVALLDARFIRPFDAELLLAQAAGKRLIVTLEESSLAGGLGSSVLEVLAEARLARTAGGAQETTPFVLRIGVPDGRFVDHGSVSDLRALIGLDVEGIVRQVRRAITEAGLTPARGRSAAARASD